MASKVHPVGSKPRRSRTCGGCGSVCRALCIFMTITFLVMPIVVFGCAAFFALLLWPVECHELGESVEGACDYREWFKYIIGNLVGLGTPLESADALNARLERVGDESVNVPHEREQESMAGGVLFWKALCYASLALLTSAR